MLKSYLNESKIHPAPLAVFRILFGSLMLIALIRFWANGWIHTLYIEPEFHFKYYGFSWVTDFGNYTYLLYVICIISSIGIILGYRYRLSIFLFFLQGDLAINLKNSFHNFSNHQLSLLIFRMDKLFHLQKYPNFQLRPEEPQDLSLIHI